MKRIVTVFIIFLLMLSSFVETGALTLYVTGVASSLSAVKEQVSGEKNLGQLIRDQDDGSDLLAYQKQELVNELGRTKRVVEGLQKFANILKPSISGPDTSGSPNGIRRAAEWLADQDPGTAAQILISLDQDLTLSLLKSMDLKPARRIVRSTEDPNTRAELSRKLNIE